MSEKKQMKWPEWNLIIPEVFVPLMYDRNRFIVMYGTRGSGKSIAAIRKIIQRCLTDKLFTCLVIREKFDSHRESTHSEFKKSIKNLGLDDFFTITDTPMRIVCKHNRNKILFIGMDDAKKAKSVAATCAFWEEDVANIPEEDFITVSAGIRGRDADYIQEIFCLNTDINDYENNWFYKRFIEHPQKNTTVHFSSWETNQWADHAYIEYLQSLKYNAYLYSVFTLGQFGNKENKSAFFKLFKRETNLDDTQYDSTLPLHISFDMNVNPGMTLIVAQLKQVEGKYTVHFIDEFLTKTPNNTSKGMCAAFSNKYNFHEAGIYVYGDSTSKKADTRLEAGSNDYTIIMNELRRFRPQLRIPTINPNVKQSGDFINYVFAMQDPQLKIYINRNLSTLINDVVNVVEAPDGTMLKQTTKVDCITFEKWGHSSDAFRYLIIQAFQSNFNRFKTGNRSPMFVERQPINTKFRF